GTVCQDKVLQRINSLKEKLTAAIGIDKLTEEIDRRLTIVESKNNPLLVYVSGKDYLLPLIKSKIRSILRFTPNEISFKNRLSQRCKIDELIGLKDYIIRQ